MATHDELVLLLKGVRLFERCSEIDVDVVAQYMETFSMSAGRPIIRTGDAGDTLYVLLSGSAHVEQDGLTIRTLGPGDWVGELAILSPAPRSADVIADSDVEVAYLRGEELEVVLDVQPSVARSLLGVLAERVRELSPGA